MNKSTSKKSLRRAIVASAFVLFFAASTFAGTKTLPEQCSIAIVARTVGAKVHICDLATVKDLAAHGHSFEQNQMGIASILKIGPEYSVNDAFDLFQRSAQKGYAPAQVNLGVMYLNGWGVERNYARALYWFQKAATEGSSARAYYNLGILYLNGQGVKQDYEQARRYFQSGAKLGDSSAQTNLAYLYDRGLGAPQDSKLAFQWYSKAASAGNPLAQHNLGDMYLRGEGVQQNDATALAWFEKAAAQRQTGAEIKLAYMLAEGRGTAKDSQKAYSYLLAASLAGDNRGKDLKSTLESRLSAEQLEQATKYAASLRSEPDQQLTATVFQQ